jgi:hypothetical protein
MQGFLARFREFPEFHRLLDALSELHVSEQRVIDAEIQAFGRDFGLFSNSLPPTLSQGLKVVQSAASEQIAISREIFPTFVGLESKIESLKRFQSEIAQLSALTRSTEENACKSQSSGSAGNEERELANQIAKANLMAIDDMKTQFLEELTRMLSNDAEVRRSACEKRIPLGRSIAGALASHQGFHDERLDGLRARLVELEAETIE